MFSLDTETTGFDMFHGARPYFVTLCDGGGEVSFWEWDVDPETREVDVPEGDRLELCRRIERADGIVCHNAKFDVTACKSVGIGLLDDGGEWSWPWLVTEDTILAAHVLGSNQPKNLTDLALRWLDRDILPLEKALEKAVKEARSWCRSHLPSWAIATEGRPDMPSAKEKAWKHDSWLPRTLRRLEGHGPPEWDTVLADYANEDSPTTVLLWQAFREELHRKGLWEVYLTSRDLLPIVWEMGDHVVTVSGEQTQAMRERYRREADEATARCMGMAKAKGFPLEMPKGGGRNGSLTEFLFDSKGLALPVVARTDTGQPSMKEEALAQYRVTLPEGSDGLRFVESLLTVRDREKLIGTLDTYERFWLPLEPNSQSPFGDTALCGWFGLHQSLNQVGTNTLRFTCEHPNLQQVGKGKDEEGNSLRSVFGPAPGREWWSFDYENLELRIPAYVAGERIMIDLFERPGEPPFYGSNHLVSFSTVYQDLWQQGIDEVGFDKVGPHCKEKYEATWYKWCKNGNFCMQYGGQEALTDATFRRKGAYRMIQERLLATSKLSREKIAFAEKHGYVETVPDRSLGLKRGYPLLCTRTEWGKILPTVPFSYFVQGTAMWCTRKAMVRCREQLRVWKRTGFDGRMVMQVHDELVFDFPKRGDPAAEARLERRLGKAPLFRTSNLWRAREIQRLMALSGDDVGVPTPVSMSYHPISWGDGVKL